MTDTCKPIPFDFPGVCVGAIAIEPSQTMSKPRGHATLFGTLVPEGGRLGVLMFIMTAVVPLAHLRAVPPPDNSKARSCAAHRKAISRAAIASDEEQWSAGALQSGHEIFCEPGFIDENEPDCGNYEDGVDLVNGGCLEPPSRVLYTPMACGDAYCATTGKSSVSPADADNDFYRFELAATLVSSVTAVGSHWWAHAPDENCVSPIGPNRPRTPPDWDGYPILHLTGCPIIPTSTYAISVVAGGSQSDPPVTASTQAKPGTKWIGDAVGAFDGAAWTTPNGVVNMDDAFAAMRTFQDPAALNATHVSVTDVDPNQHGMQINKVVNFDDVFVQILGFHGFEYPGRAAELCPDL